APGLRIRDTPAPPSRGLSRRPAIPRFPAGTAFPVPSVLESIDRASVVPMPLCVPPGVGVQGCGPDLGKSRPPRYRNSSVRSSRIRSSETTQLPPALNWPLGILRKEKTAAHPPLRRFRRFQRFPWMREQSACGSTLEDRQPETSVAVESIFDATVPNVKNSNRYSADSLSHGKKHKRDWTACPEPAEGASPTSPLPHPARTRCVP